jgi:biofilm PGA synthesis N-glycosyltransferase PgaC
MPVTPADATVLIPRQRAASFTVHGRHHSQTPPSARIAALIPTCNEPAIEATIASVRRQTLPPAHIVVVVNNSTDDTAERARAAGATVVEMTENRHKKSGALNWGYDLIRVRLPDVEYIVQMDADTVLERHFVERTYAVLSRPENWNVGALSSAFIAKPGLARSRRQAVWMWPQAAEYARYQDAQVSRNVHCVSGTGNMFRVAALDGLRADRGGIIWDNRSLVEDYEVTLALRAMHWDCRKSKKFIAYTDLMPTLSMLWRQRLRWQRGTFDELRRYGWTASTRPDWAKQILHGLLMLAHVAGFAVCFASIGYAVWADRPMRVSAWLVVPLGIIACKQAWHIRDMGWRSVLIALLIVPEEAYNLLRHAWWLRGLWLSLRSRQQSW